MSTKRFAIFFSVLTCLVYSGFAQTLTGTLQLKTLHTTGKALPQTSIVLEGDSSYTFISDEEGNAGPFEIPTGRYTLRSFQEGYVAAFLPEVLIVAGKTTSLEIFLSPQTHTLPEIEVREKFNISEANPVSAHSFTIEQTQRFAGGFFDPARLATSLPGVHSAMDMANNLSIRGNAPTQIVWQIDGMEIVNPNHLSNGGTVNDRISLSGGGVNILSGQMLNTSTLYTSVFPSSLGNAVGGVFDMQLRKGNNNRRQYTAQASLIGIDLAIEGPLKRNAKSSYLINYRYSTLGLLNAMGVSLGGETFIFQDLSAHLHLPTKKAGTFKWFAFGGISENKLTPNEDTLEWKVAKDRMRIHFDSRMGASGMSHQIQIGSKLQLKTQIISSGFLNQNQFNLLQKPSVVLQSSTENLFQSKSGVASNLKIHFIPQHQTSVGISAMQHVVGIESNYSGPLTQTMGSTWLIQPHVQHQMNFHPNVMFQIGLHGYHSSLNGAQAIDPRAQISHQIHQKHLIAFASGVHSQLPFLGSFFSNQHQFNHNLNFQRALHYVFKHVFQWNPNQKISTELYVQEHFQVPVSKVGDSYSMFNQLEGFYNDSLTSTGRAISRGIEMMYQRNMQKGFYCIVSGSLYEAQYRGSDLEWRKARFNGRFSTQITTGKEWNWKTKKADQNRSFGIHIRVIAAGGFQGTPIDVPASEKLQQTVYVQNMAYAQQLPNYFRTDIRIAIRKNKTSYTRTLSLDIQNITNQANVGFYYYEPSTKTIDPKYQLGLIPVLSYRVEF